MSLREGLRACVRRGEGGASPLCVDAVQTPKELLRK